MLEADHLVDLDPVVHRERGRLSCVQQGDGALPQLHFAGRYLGVTRAFGAEPHGADDSHYVLAPHVDRTRDDALDDAGVIPQIDECQVLPVLAPLGHPATHGHRAPDVDSPQRPAHVGPQRGDPG
jgi:hypothetical protein